MLSKETLEKIAGMLQLNVEDMTKAITSEDEVKFELPELKVFKPQDLDTLLDNRGKERYDAGRIAEREMLYKNMSKEVGLETIKDPEEFIKTYKSKILDEAKIEPQKKVQELETSVSNLRKELESANQKYIDFETSVSRDKLKLETQGYFPDMPDTLGLTKAEATSLFFMNHEIKDGVVYKNGQPLKDRYESNISLQDAVKSFVSDKGWDKSPSGRGGGAGGGSGGNGLPKTMDEYQTYIKTKGINEGSSEANALLMQIAKENPEILN